MTSSSSSAQPTGRADVVEAVVTAAADQLSAVGPARLNIRTVAEAAGVNHALIHRHLQTKERLVAAALDHLVAQSFDEVEAGVGDPWKLADYPHVRRYVMALARCLLDEPALVAGQSQFPVLQNLIERDMERGSDSETAAARSIAWLCAIFGAELFGPHLCEAAGIELDGGGGPLEVIDSALSEKNRAQPADDDHPSDPMNPDE